MSAAGSPGQTAPGGAYNRFTSTLPAGTVPRALAESSF